MHIHLIATIGEGVNERRDIAQETSLAVFLSDSFPGVDFSSLCIRVNSQDIPPTTTLGDGDVICVIPAKYDGSVWVPSLRDFEGYLKSIGFRFDRPGPGDHEIWKRADGKKVSLNRDGKEVDLASVRRLAKCLGLRHGELVMRMKGWQKGVAC